MPSLGRSRIRPCSIKIVVLNKNNAFKAYNSKNNSKNNNCYNWDYREKHDLCLRLRILFVSFFGSCF